MTGPFPQIRQAAPDIAPADHGDLGVEWRGLGRFSLNRRLLGSEGDHQVHRFLRGARISKDWSWDPVRFSVASADTGYPAGWMAVAAYTESERISGEAFQERLRPVLTPARIGEVVVELLLDPDPPYAGVLLTGA